MKQDGYEEGRKVVVVTCSRYILFERSIYIYMYVCMYRERERERERERDYVKACMIEN